MSQPAKTSVEMKDFPGLASKPDADDLAPGGAQVQVNLMSARPGQLRSRPGYQQLAFDDEE